MTLDELALEPTEDLIEYMNWKSQPEHLELAENAFIVFCNRFCDRVQSTCRIIGENNGLDHTHADKIAEKIFAKFWKYQKYKPGKCVRVDRDLCVEMYLYTFAQHGLTDYLLDLKNPFKDAQIRTEFPDLEDYYNILDDDDLPEEKKAQIKTRYELTKRALDRLSPNHKIIYLTYLPYENQLKGGEHYLPREFLKKLQDALGLSQASIRVYKKQAYDKIKEFLDLYGSK